ncbi:MAG: site-2 protease family protein [Candidatus Colwellbacteria bacterium]|nr:site-2 protease family protein [Candidatus Colwellbacteria bacterium]
MEWLIEGVFFYVIVVLSATVHEYAHAFAAFTLGDSTARDAGRLSLNPLVHLDPIGTVILPLALFLTSGIFIGWARPVPYNPHRLQDKKFGTLKVALAGPLANFTIALAFGLALRLLLLPLPIFSSDFTNLLELVVRINLWLMLFNLIPFPPLDGSKIAAEVFPRLWRGVASLGIWGFAFALFAATLVLPPVVAFLFRGIVGA